MTCDARAILLPCHPLAVVDGLAFSQQVAVAAVDVSSIVVQVCSSRAFLSVGFAAARVVEIFARFFRCIQLLADVHHSLSQRRCNGCVSVLPHNSFTS